MIPIPQPKGRVYIREPWASRIMAWEKWVETAHFALPDRFRNIWLDVQTDRREVVGMVRFNWTYEYESAEHFDDDYAMHKVSPDSAFYYGKRRRTHAWHIQAGHIWKYLEPRPAGPMKSQFRLELYDVDQA